MNVFLNESAPIPVFGTAGSVVSLSAVLSAAFGSSWQYADSLWISSTSVPLARAEFGFAYDYWAAPNVDARWTISGGAAEFDQHFFIPKTEIGNVSAILGNSIINTLYFSLGSVDPLQNWSTTWYTINIVDAAFAPYVKPTPTPSDIVATALRFADRYPNLPNTEDCHAIASAVAAAAGAPFPVLSGDTDPTKNVEGGLWRIVHRGSDNPVAAWQTLVQPGDIVRLDWINSSFHTFTVISSQRADGQIEVYDNSNFVGGQSTIGVHWADYDDLTYPASITIYRLSADSLYLIHGTDVGDTVAGTLQSDDIRSGSGADEVYAESGADVVSLGGGNDRVNGGAGDDTIDGGDGIDTAAFNGLINSYLIERAGLGVIVDGPVGRDNLINIEKLEFDDRIFDLTGADINTSVAAQYNFISRVPVSEAPIGDLLKLGSVSPGAATGAIVDIVDGTTALVVTIYQFFTGRTTSEAGLNYLVNSPDTVNASDLNDPYYQTFGLENRYINFAVNLGKLGEGRADFVAEYGWLSLFAATKQAYAEIFGNIPTDAKVNEIINTQVSAGGVPMSRAEYFAYYGTDDIGTKAAMVGWLLGEAMKADVGVYATAAEQFLIDLADGVAQFNVDLLAAYGGGAPTIALAGMPDPIEDSFFL